MRPFVTYAQYPSLIRFYVPILKRQNVVDRCDLNGVIRFLKERRTNWVMAIMGSFATYEFLIELKPDIVSSGVNLVGILGGRTVDPEGLVGVRGGV